jgi:hypothetical protein
MSNDNENRPPKYRLITTIVVYSDDSDQIDAARELLLGTAAIMATSALVTVDCSRQTSHPAPTTETEEPKTKKEVSPLN